ncbi:MFS transporter [Nocardiopsis sp. MG754419]|uniref:MFS transporter n=1 Tax=Nocardiopsis sp. MG754419 TaxID=2259865 RepID=UPI001BAC446B|nr:MFS transporter [Nocardiopsis sp. MG754419]MBR8743285.1 MFS transporter [Nocardiopsis sp. MG754419]
MAQRTPPHSTTRTDREPLGPGFRRLLGAVGAGNLGDGIAIVALPWYAATLTDDPLQVALVGAATRLPWLLFALLAGVVGDRVDRRRLMMTAGGVKAVLLVLLTAVVALGVGSIPLLVVIALAVGVCEVFFDNTAMAMVPTVVARSRLERANGAFQGVERVLNKFVGAPVAGMLLAASTAWAFGAQAVLILLGVTLLLTLRGEFRPTVADEARPALWGMLREGVVWLWRHPVLRPMALITGASNLATALMAAVLVLFAQDVLGVGPQGYGLLMTVTAAGAVLGAVVVPFFAGRVHPATAMAVILAVMGAAALAIGLVHDVALFVAGYFVTGFVSSWWNITVLSLFQRLTPDALRSRAFSAHRTLSWGMLSVGMGLGGALATVLEGPMGREWALAAPFVGAGLIDLTLAGVAVLVFGRAMIDRALSEAATG